MARFGSPFAIAVGLDVAVALNAECFHFGGSLAADYALSHATPPIQLFGSFHHHHHPRGSLVGDSCEENEVTPCQ